MQTTKMKISKADSSEAGFSLIELLISTAILLLLMAGVFSQVAKMQNLSRAEENKRDMFQNVREVLDQMNRDLHAAGYPNKSLFNLGGQYANGGANPLGAGVSNTAADQNTGAAVRGLVVAQNDLIVFEGDVDGDGIVDSVAYQYSPAVAGFSCPCLLRSQVNKVAGDPRPVPNGGAQVTMSNTNVVIENLLAPGVIGASPPPIFQFFNSAGGQIDPGAGLTYSPSNSLTSPIRSVQITLNAQAAVADVSHFRPKASMTITSRLTNY